MAAAVLNPQSKQGKKTSSRGTLPVKNSINLASVGAKPIKLSIAIPAIILILLAAAALSKFGVIDRFNTLSKAESEVSRLRSELNSAYNTLSGYGELTEEYAHYTVSGMTNEELTRVDRSQVVDLIQRVILPKSELGNWFVTGNQLNLTITGKTLQEVNLLVQSLDEEALVDFCTVKTAATNDKNNGILQDDTVVVAQIVVYLVAGEGAA